MRGRVRASLGLLGLGIALLIAAAGPLPANNVLCRAAYVRCQSPPWESNRNEWAMDQAFGAGNWDTLFLETAGAQPFQGGYGVVFLEGGDRCAQELAAYVAANRATMQNWVAAGGALLENAGPNEGGSFSMGFGVTLRYTDSGRNAHALDGAHPIFNGPLAPNATSFTGSWYSHASVSGAGLAGLLRNEGGTWSLAETGWGAGWALFGGMTTTNFHVPQPQADNLRANILAFLRGKSLLCGTAPACPLFEVCYNRLDDDGDTKVDEPPCLYDQDRDGLGYEQDNCMLVPNPDQKDSDCDGLGDACDNCPDAKNLRQADWNRNRIGNACEPFGGDRDQDRVPDAADNCPDYANPDQTDSDGDGAGNACDNCPKLANPDQADQDCDGWGDFCDNCPTCFNATQRDMDKDGTGDVCKIQVVPIR